MAAEKSIAVLQFFVIGSVSLPSPDKTHYPGLKEEVGCSSALKGERLYA